MNVTGFDLYRYSLPLSRPLRLKRATLHHREGLLLRLSGDGGSEGWGESAPLPGFSEESLELVIEQLRHLAGTLIGCQISDDWIELDGMIGRELERFNAAPSFRFGFELAVRNLYVAPSAGPFSMPHRRSVVPVSGLLSGNPDGVLGEARRMRDAGYRAIKLKVGALTVAEDARLVRSLAGELGKATSLRLDANRAWDYEDAARFFGGVAGVRFEYIEEPLADPARMPDLAEEFGLPLALDESLAGMEPEHLEEHGYARAVVLKPTLLGGISRTLRMADHALRLGMTPVLSSAYESGVGTAALVALAAVTGERPVPAGLDTYRALEEDVLDSPLGLPAPSVDVGEVATASRKVDVGKLQPL